MLKYKILRFRFNFEFYGNFVNYWLFIKLDLYLVDRLDLYLKGLLLVFSCFGWLKVARRNLAWDIDRLLWPESTHLEMGVLQSKGQKVCSRASTYRTLGQHRISNSDRAFPEADTLK
jgi:hypothetical protein